MVNGFRQRWKASAQHQIYLPLSPFTNARSESINADSLNSNFLQLGRSGGRPQRTVHPVRLPVNTVIHTTLVGLEPTTFRSLVRRATSSATDSPRPYDAVTHVWLLASKRISNLVQAYRQIRSLASAIKYGSQIQVVLFVAYSNSTM